MSELDPDARSRELAADSLADDDPTGWFEQLYVAAEGGEAVVPWDREAPSALLVQWAVERRLDGTGQRAVVVGCGLGRDAEFIAARGFDTVAFDVSETAIRMARDRHAGSAVDYVTGDLFWLPRGWFSRFDLVVESMTIQSLPEAARAPAITNVGGLLAPGGTLIVIALARDEHDHLDLGPPWPLSRSEVEAFATDDTRAVRIEDITAADEPAVHRWRAEFYRPG